MKRSIFILLAASALAALSCTKEVNDQTAPEKEMVTMSFDATLAAPTKVELGTSTDDGYKVMWSAGDAISVFADDPTKTSGYTNGTKFTTDITAPNATATFTGETEVVEDYYAAIPYNSVHRWYYAEEYFSLDFYTVQTADGLNNGLAFAKAENGSLQFEHVTGYIKFTIPETYTDIKQVSVKGNDNETIGGNYVSVYLDGTTEVLANHVALELILVPEGEVFEPGVYYIAAVPAEINSGLTITFTNTDNEVAKKTSSTAFEIKAGDILNLGTVANLNFEAQNIPAVTVEDFLDLEESSTKYQLTGIISNIVNTQYGNFDLTDATGTVYVYGLTATPVASNDKSFSSLGLKEGDEVTLVGTRSSHNGEPQVGGPAYYVSHKACVAAPVVSCEDNTVTITAEAGATVYYTTDESDPVTSNTRLTYSAPFEIDETTVVKAYAVADGKPKSVVVTNTFVVSNEEVTVVLYESFDTNEGTGGNDGNWNGSIASNDIKSDLTWEFTKGYGAYKCAKFGSSSAKGVAVTPALGASGNMTLTFKAGAWSGDNGTTLTLSIDGGASLSQTEVTMQNGAWTEYAITITGATENSKITFAAKIASKNRFFLDEVKVVK